MDKIEKLAVVLGSELNMQVEGMEEKFRATLIGIETPIYLMVRMQIPTMFRSQIDKGTTFLVRYVYMGNLYGFRTKSLGSVEKPYKITFISYPENVESLNIRRSKRVSCFIPSTLELGKSQLRGLVVEISKTGIRFAVNTETDLIKMVKLNDPVKISFPLLGFDGIHTIKGIIKGIISDTAGISLGIQFEDVKPLLEGMIENYVKDVLDLL